MQFNLENIVRNSIKNIQAYSSARDEFKSAESTDLIFLDANENPFENGLNRYPDPQQIVLKNKISSLKGIPATNILLGNGSDEVLDLLFRAFAEPKVDNIITLPPTYGMYKVLAALNSVVEKEILLTEHFEPDVENILKFQNEHSKMLFLCSPNNPTGNSFNPVLVEELIKSFKGLVVIDEAYIDFSSHESWINRLSEFPNLIITQTFSKAYGLAGIRLGMCFASVEIISILNKIKPPYNVNLLSQKKALEQLLKLDEIEIEKNKILKQRNLVFEGLKQISFINKVYRSDANFLLIKVDNANLRYHQLIEKGIVVRNRTKQPLCENTLRITIGTEKENKKLLQVLKAL